MDGIPPTDTPMEDFPPFDKTMDGLPPADNSNPKRTTADLMQEEIDDAMAGGQIQVKAIERFEQEIIWVDSGHGPLPINKELWMYRNPDKDSRPGHLTLRFKATFVNSKGREMNKSDSKLNLANEDTQEQLADLFRQMTRGATDSAPLAKSLLFFFNKTIVAKPLGKSGVKNTSKTAMPYHYMDIKFLKYNKDVYDAIKEIVYKSKGVVFEYLGDTEGQGHIVPDHLVLS